MGAPERDPQAGPPTLEGPTRALLWLLPSLCVRTLQAKEFPAQTAQSQLPGPSRATFPGTWQYARP